MNRDDTVSNVGVENRRGSGLDSGAKLLATPIVSSVNDGSELGEVEQPADVDGLYWTQVADVPDMNQRPILDSRYQALNDTHTAAADNGPFSVRG